MAESDLLVPSNDLRKLLAAACPDAALLYLYIKSGGSPEAARDVLRLSQRQVEYAGASLRQLGLWPQEPERRLLPAEAPAYTEADITREYAAGPEFPNMVGETQRRLGRILSTEELKILLNLYRYLGLPTEVITILVNYCISRAQAHGSGRMPAIRTIEKEGYRWADLGIDTMEEAAVYMQNQLQLQSMVGRVQQALQLTDRRLTPGEEKLVMSWISWGFGEKEIRMAYEKTCMNTGGLKWPYLNSILKSWHEQGFTTVRQIEAGDKAPAPPEKPQRAVQRHDDALSQLEKEAIQKMMNKGLYKEE